MHLKRTRSEKGHNNTVQVEDVIERKERERKEKKK